jgi:hypothetical protein
MSTLTRSALHQIIEATGHWPAERKPSDLGRELLHVIHEYNFLRNVGDEAKEQWDRLSAIHRHATALSKVLAADEKKGGMFTENWRPLRSEDVPSASKLISKMAELVEQSGLLETSSGNIAAQTRANYSASGISAFDWLVGKALPELFERFFREDATVYRDGTYARFALQVLAKLNVTNNGQAYSPETIIKALRYARGGHRRGGQKQ